MMTSSKVRTYRRGRAWYASWRDPRMGRRVWRSLGTDLKAQAEAAASKIQVELVEKRYFDDRRPSQIALKEYAPRYLEHAKMTKRSYRNDEQFMARFVREWGDRALSEITPALVEAYKAQRVQETIKGRPGGKLVTRSTVDHELVVLRRALNLAVEWDLLQACPRIRLFHADTIRTAYLDELQAVNLLRACENPRAPHLHALVKLALNTGMRRGELLRLKWSDVDFANGIIHVQQGKTGRRAVPLIPGGREALQSVMTADRLLTTPGSPWVFANAEGHPYTDPKTAFIAARRRAGLDGLHFHDLRHAYARQFLVRGGSMAQLRVILGHASYRMTERYVAFSEADTVQTARRLGDLWGQKPGESPAAIDAVNAPKLSRE